MPSKMMTKKTTSAPETPVNPVEAKLDRVIELLERIAGHSEKIPFQGIDLGSLVK